jgi:hypothetical protein
MDERELTYEEAIRRLTELFSDDPSAPPTRTCRKYFLENQDGEPVFRLAEMPGKPTLPRSEIEVVFDEVMLELFGPDPDGDEIVPQKQAKLFPGRSRRQAAKA